MFVRKKRNSSGTVSIQVIDKTHGYKIVRTVGSARDPDVIEQLIQQGKRWIIQYKHRLQLKLLPLQNQQEQIIDSFLSELTNACIRTVGPELIFGTLFDRIGFDKVGDELFRHLVIARLAYPTSKLGTVDYLYRYRGIKISVDNIYRFLDTLASRYQQTVEEITFGHTKKLLKGKISVVFYDLTTIYFETESEDDLRKIGFSKDGKFNKPQIILGLLVAIKGYPLGYELFEGNTFEGHTLIPAIKRLERKFNIKKPIVVADAGLLSRDNREALADTSYRYIIGARIKNESNEIKKEILKFKLTDQETTIFPKKDKTRLIVGYSMKRAKKDKHNREKGLKRLEKRLHSGRLTKSHINNRGYNKYLKLKGKIEITIDYQKFQEDSQWDGLKGYITNTRLKPKTIIAHYSQLWQIEKAFRISKTDLRIRPVYHYRKKRIKAHLCIAFTAYAIYKELERLLEKQRVSLSPQRAAKLTHTMYAIEHIHPKSGIIKQVVLKMDQEQKSLYKVICNSNP